MHRCRTAQWIFAAQKSSGPDASQPNARFAPNKVVVHRPPGDAPRIVKIAPYTAAQRDLGGKATAYVCTNYMCRLPVTDSAKVWR
jgi:uncharacterized protein YyaL (SSP411 family)